MFLAFCSLSLSNTDLGSFISSLALSLAFFTFAASVVPVPTPTPTPASVAFITC